MASSQNAPLARHSQFKILSEALSSSSLPQSLFLWGLSSTGKTFVLNKAILNSNIPHTARISATEIMCGRRPFFETLLRQLSSKMDRCDNIRQFIRHLIAFTRRPEEDTNPATIIIIDDAEHLIKEHGEILQTFSRLGEFVQSQISVVFSSNLSPISFGGVTNMRNIPSIHFPQYAKEEIVQIITQCYAPLSAATSDKFDSYVRLTVDVFYQRCRDLKKLLRLVISNWDFVRGQSEGQSLLKTWKNIEPRLKSDFKALNSHFLPMTDKSQLQSISTPGNSTSTSTPGSKPVGAVLESKKNFECIPKYTRYLIVASYLATHNPPTSDKRFFVKHSSRKYGKSGKYHGTGGLLGAGQEDGENASAERTRALRSFDQNRLKSIFAFFVHYCSGGVEVFESNVDLGVQLTSLCQSRFIQNLGEDGSGNFKFRCLADYDFVLDVANSIGFELEKYLYRLL